MRGLRMGILNMFGFTPTHRAVREAVEWWRLRILTSKNRVEASEFVAVGCRRLPVHG